MKAISLLLTLLLAAASFAAPKPQASNSNDDKISREVRHEILMLPYYSVFDILEYSVSGTTVTLRGYVSPMHSSLKSEAENAVKHIDGVQKVINQIQALPPSSDDDQIRRAEYRAIYGYDPLFKYAWGAVEQIHIIVNMGHVALYGVVDSDADKQMILSRAKGVPGTFAVDDHLQVATAQQK